MSKLATSPLRPSHDNHLVRDVNDALRATLGRNSERLEISAKNGVITLRGVLASYYQRQLTLHAAKKIRGVNRLCDELAVLPTN